MEPEEFERDLMALIGRPTDLRPFVCDGSPLACSVFIVGFNPATTVSIDFWQFWRSSYGFTKLSWLNTYIEERRVRPLKPGKKRRNTISNTRRVIEWIVEEASPIKCLETNIYAAPSEQATDLSMRLRITAPFDFLLRAINPRIIVAHGSEATTHILEKQPSAHVISVNHFSRGWSQDGARKLGRQIKDVFETAPKYAGA